MKLDLKNKYNQKFVYKKKQSKMLKFTERLKFKIQNKLQNFHEPAE